jgi:hypothetical protein
MTSKPRSSKLPTYSMLGSTAARQDPGLGPTAIELLQANGHIDDDPVQERRNPLESPVTPMASPETSDEQAPAEFVPVRATEPTIEPNAAPGRRRSTATKPRSSQPRPLADATAGEQSAKKHTKPRKTRGPRGAGRGSPGYNLPPAVRRETHSHHFRLPEDVDKHLTELAEAHACTRTHVVCAAIESEWARLHRRKARTASAEPE